MTTFGILKRLDLRSIWQNEASDFTPWLADNIQELGKTLGKDLELVEREAQVGDFSLDLHAVDLGSNKTVVVENQLTPTDHDHLGKLLTYASGFNAAVVVWVAKEIREEHRQALQWLNDISDVDTEFFGVVLELLQIDEGNPAFNFKPIVFPNEWRKSKKVTRQTQTSERQEAYRDFFQGLIDILRDEHKFTNARKAQPMSWYHFSMPFKSVLIGLSFALGERVRVELYIDRDDDKELFDALFARKDDIVFALGGGDIEWERLDGKRASRIALYRDGSINDDENIKEDIKNWAIENLLKLKQVMSQNISQIDAR